MNNNLNKCYWVTGLSASGKTTLSTMLVEHLRNKGIPVVHFDGDDLRQVFLDNGNSLEDRLNRAKKISRLCKLISDQNINIVIGIIGLFKELHEWNRVNIKNYVEIFLDIPLIELEKRDPKGIYEKAKEGKMNNVAGIHVKVEFPSKPDIIINWKKDELPKNTFKRLLKEINSI